DKQLLNLAKWSTLSVCSGRITFDLMIPNVFDLMVFIFDLWDPLIVPVIAIALLLGKSKERVISPFAAITAMLAGIVVSLVWNYVLHEPFELPSLIAGIIANLLTIFIVHKLTSKKQPFNGFYQESLVFEAESRNILYVIMEYPSICIAYRH